MTSKQKLDICYVYQASAVSVPINWNRVAKMASTATDIDRVIPRTSKTCLEMEPTEDLEAQDFYQQAQGTHPHDHFSGRAPWLRAGVLGANDGQLLLPIALHCHYIAYESRVLKIYCSDVTGGMSKTGQRALQVSYQQQVL
jgi:hypothetical protein